MSEMKRKKWFESTKGYLAALLILCLYAFVANWSILLGENLMKWDIWDAEYPFQMLMSDALANHTLPLWNPLMRYGTPNYAMVGTPVWYPLTMVLALFGYTPVTLAVSYVMHVVIGGMGMFLLAHEEICSGNAESGCGEWCASVAAGLLYCGSGIFLSNAQHIMIIISAAWIPWVFFFTKRFLAGRKWIYCMLAGACAAMILLGGYPEMFYDMFLLLIPYVLFQGWQKSRSVFQNAVYAAKKYVLICICTILAGAVTLLPFLANVKYITRTAGAGQVLQGKPLMAALSFLFSGVENLLPTGEISMGNFYTGILVILLLPAIFRAGHKCRKLYVFLAMGCFIFCWGEDSFVGVFLYRFFPMYSSFRFPTLNRAMLAMFMILAVTPELRGLLERRVDRQTAGFGKKLLLAILACALAGTLVGSFAGEAAGVKTQELLQLTNSLYKTIFLLGMWLFVFWLAGDGRLGKRAFQAAVVGAVSVELLTFALTETPITITRYTPVQYGQDVAVKEKVEEEFTKNRERKKDINFAGHRRSTSGLNSNLIVYQKTFDEEGYVSFKLQSTESFLWTYNRSIIEQNPVAYFTNNVVTEQDMPYDTWVNLGTVPPEQIFADVPLENPAADPVMFETEKNTEYDLSLQVNGSEVLVDGLAELTNAKARRVRFYFEPKTSGTVSMELSFATEDGSLQSAAGDYQVRVEDGVPYVDVYFPEISKKYQSVKIVSASAMPVSARMVVLKRMAADRYVQVEEFGFNSIGMTVNAPTEGYLALLQAKHDGWTAYVDGEEQEIHAVDGCFMGLHLQPGEHRIIMRFRPKEFFVGAGITIAYFLALAALGIYSIFAGRAKNKRKLQGAE